MAADAGFPKIKNFFVQKRLGSGSYATVYKALSQVDQKVYAVKCISKASLNKTSTENLLREIAILKRIKHEYIVEMVDFQWDDRFIFLIMEFCAGGDLSAFIKSKRTVPEKYAKKFVQQIACALKHLHSKGIAHMDLKPQNILMTSLNDPVLKLGDFGFAQYLREDTVSRSLRGSPLYMAPEILKNQLYDSRVDLWSVGVIFHEVLFGYAPFVSQSIDELERKILDDTPIRIPETTSLSKSCIDLLTRLLKRNPNERISFEQFFAHPFIDMDHMPSISSFTKASELLRRAVSFDEKKDFFMAQKSYLQAIEYLLAAIKFEKNPAKKAELREKAKTYMNRAEELALVLKPEKSSTGTATIVGTKTLPARPDSPQVTTTERGGSGQPFEIPITRQSSNPGAESIYRPRGASGNAGASFSSSTAGVEIPILRPRSSDSQTLVGQASSSSSSSQDFNMGITSIDFQQAIANPNVQALVKLSNGSPEVQTAIKMCLDADEKQPTSVKYQELFNQYESALSVLIPFMKTMKKETDEFKVLKVYTNKWLTKAEHLEKSMQEQQANEMALLKTRESFVRDETEEDTVLDDAKSCILQ